MKNPIRGEVTRDSKFPVEFTYKGTQKLIEGISKEGYFLIWSEKGPVAIDEDSFWASLEEGSQKEDNKIVDTLPTSAYNGRAIAHLDSDNNHNSILGTLFVPEEDIDATEEDKISLSSILPSAKVYELPHGNSYEYVQEVGIGDIVSQELSKKYGFSTLNEMWDNLEELKNPNDVYAEFQKASVVEFQKRTNADVVILIDEDEIYPLQFKVFNMKSIERRYGANTESANEDIDSLIGELDGAVESHKETEQTVAENEIQKLSDDTKAEMEQLLGEIDSDRESICAIIKKGGPMAEAMYATMEQFPKRIHTEIYKRSQIIHNAYLAKLPNGGKDVRDEFYTVFNNVARTLFKEQKLTVRKLFKHAHRLFDNESSSEGAVRSDPSTWINSYTGDYVGSTDNTNYTDNGTDVRWMEVKWDYSRILSECKKQYGTLEDLREKANDEWLDKFFSDNFLFDSEIYGYWSKEKPTKNPTPDRVPAVVEEVMKMTIQPSLITVLNVRGMKEDYDKVTKLEIDRDMCFNTFTMWDRVFRASMKDARISDIETICHEEEIFAPYKSSRGYREFSPPWGTTIETEEYDINAWCTSFKIYKNGSVKMRVPADISEKLIRYLLKYAIPFVEGKIKTQ